jgi:hypothetical protein
VATENPVLVYAGFIAGEDMSTGLNGYNSTGLYLIAKMSANDTVVHCSAHADKPIGIIQGNPKSGDGCPVMGIGVSKVVAGGTLVAGDSYGPDSSGRAVAKASSLTGADLGDFVMGQVLTGATVGQLATVTVFNPTQV